MLLREVQRDPITHRPIAADFQRVSSTEAIYASVRIVTVGVPLGVKDQGGVMDIVTHALEVKGPAGKLPEHFEIDVSALNVNDHITAGEVKLPAGFTLITPADTVVVGIEGSRTASEDAATHRRRSSRRAGSADRTGSRTRRRVVRLTSTTSGSSSGSATPGPNTRGRGTTSGSSSSKNSRAAGTSTGGPSGATRASCSTAAARRRSSSRWRT